MEFMVVQIKHRQLCGEASDVCLAVGQIPQASRDGSDEASIKSDRNG